MKNRFSHMLIAVLILTTGCTRVTPSTSETPLIDVGTRYPVTQTSPIATTSPTHLATRTSIPSTPVPTNTLTPTPKITASPDTLPKARLKIQCLDIADSISPLLSNGTLILQFEGIGSGEYRTATSRLDLATGVSTQISGGNERLSEFVISPDRKRIAYKRVSFNEKDGDQLVISSSNVEQQKSFMWEVNWGSIVEWLDNERLLISIPDPGEGQLLRPSTFVVLNLSTGKSQTLPPDYPDIFHLNPLAAWGRWGEVMYNQNLTRVIYIREDEQKLRLYRLWDPQKRQELASFRITRYPTPLWSPDGTHFVITNLVTSDEIDADTNVYREDDLYLIDQNGISIKRLTYLSYYFPEWFFIENYSWSPDGRHIAFWVRSHDPSSDQSSGEQQLAVLDMTSLEVINYCIPGDYESPNDTSAPAPIWSPDGTQLVVENWYAEKSRFDLTIEGKYYSDLKNRVILIDIEKGLAAQAAENMSVLGWMAAP